MPRKPPPLSVSCTGRSGLMPALHALYALSRTQPSACTIQPLVLAPTPCITRLCRGPARAYEHGAHMHILAALPCSNLNLTKPLLNSQITRKHGLHNLQVCVLQAATGCITAAWWGAAVSAGAVRVPLLKRAQAAVAGSRPCVLQPRQSSAGTCEQGLSLRAGSSSLHQPFGGWRLALQSLHGM